MGSFADFGWAWNVKPSSDIVGSRKAAVPSAEFVESFLIFFYGSTNVFLEHLAQSGGEWSATDLEHVSIAVMFFGGGLVSQSLLRPVLHSLISIVRNASGVEKNSESAQFDISITPFPSRRQLFSRRMAGSQDVQLFTQPVSRHDHSPPRNNDELSPPGLHGIYYGS